MTKQIFRRDVLYHNLEDQQRNDNPQPNNDSNQPNKETTTVINFDTMYQQLDNLHDGNAKLKESIARDRAKLAELAVRIERLERDAAAKAAKTDAQEKPNAAQEQKVRSDSEKRLDRSQEAYLANRGLQKHPKLDEVQNNYLVNRGLSRNYDSGNCYSSNF